MIQSYPWTPDCLALCTWVAAEDGDAEALAMLAAEAQSKQQAAQQAAQTSSGGSGNTLAGTGGMGGGAGTPGASAPLGLPGNAPMFLPTAFGAMPGPFGGPGLMQGLQPLPGFNPLMHSVPSGPATWGSCMATSAMQLPQPMGHAGSGCLPVHLGLPHLAGSGSGKAGGLIAELGGNSSTLVLPISPNIGTVSSATN